MIDEQRARAISRLLRLSGWLELSLGAGHNVVGTLILTRPETMTPVVAMLGWPVGIAAPLVHPEQRDLVLAMSLGSGAAWMVFGALLVWLGRPGAAPPARKVLQFVWVYQASLLVLMVLFVRFHVLAILVVIAMLAALSVAIRHARAEGES